MRLAGGIVATRENDGLDGAIQFRNGDLQGHLHRVQAKVALFPLLGGLEDEGKRHHVRTVELLQRLNRLGVVLTGRTSDQRKTGEGDDAVHQGLLGIQRVIEESVDRLGEVETAAEDRNHASATELQLLDGGHVMGIVTGDDVAALQHQTDHRPFAGFLRKVGAAGGPVQIFLEVLEHRGGQGVPDAEVGEHFGLRHLHCGAFLAFCSWEDVLVRQHQQEVAQVVGGTAQPVLEAEHEAAGILRLLNRQVLENGGQRVQQLEHRVLEASTSGFLPLLHEACDGALALTELGHREAAQLVEPHHFRHGREDHSRLESVAVGGNGVHNLLRQIFDEDQGGHKDISLSHVGAEAGVVVVVAEFFDQIAAQLDPEIATGSIESRRCLGEGVLVLGLQHHINRLHDGLVVLALHRSNAAIGGADLCEHQRALSNVKNLTATGP